MSTLEQEYRDHGFTPEWLARASVELRNLTDKEIHYECPYLHWKEYHTLIKCIYES